MHGESVLPPPRRAGRPDQPNEQRGALLASLPRDLSDTPTFNRAVTDFLADIQYARVITAAASAAAA
ncbi:MAG: hypothetical protein ACO32J_06960, partial [Phycisphaerales bacterium]